MPPQEHPTTSANSAPTPEGQQPQVALYKSAMASRHKVMDITLSSLIDKVRSGHWRQQVEQIRHASTPEEQRKLKAQLLPGFTPTGTMPTEARHGGQCKGIPKSNLCDKGSLRRDGATELTTRTGLVALDIDSYKDGGTAEDAAAIRNKLAESPHCAAVFISTSGVGVKALIAVSPVPASQTEHRSAWDACVRWVQAKLDIEPNTKTNDPPGNNIAHLQFVSWDSAAHLNLGAEPLSLAEWVEPEPERKPAGGYRQDIPTGGPAELTEQEVREMLLHCDPDESWPDYCFKLARAVRAWDDGGARGNAVWLEFIQRRTRSPHESDYERSYDQGDGTGPSITVGTLVELAKKGGYHARRDRRDSTDAAHARTGVHDVGPVDVSHLSRREDIVRGLATFQADAFSPLGAATLFLSGNDADTMVVSEAHQLGGIQYVSYFLDEIGVWQRESPWMLAAIGDSVRAAVRDAYNFMLDRGINPKTEHRRALWSLYRDAGSMPFQKRAAEVVYQAAREFEAVTWSNRPQSRPVPGLHRGQELRRVHRGRRPALRRLNRSQKAPHNAPAANRMAEGRRAASCGRKVDGILRSPVGMAASLPGSTATRPTWRDVPVRRGAPRQRQVHDSRGPAGRAR